MVKIIKFPLALLLVVVIVFPMTVATGDEKTKTYRVSYLRKTSVGKLIKTGSKNTAFTLSAMEEANGEGEED